MERDGHPSLIQGPAGCTRFLPWGAWPEAGAIVSGPLGEPRSELCPIRAPLGEGAVGQVWIRDPPLPCQRGGLLPPGHGLESCLE